MIAILFVLFLIYGTKIQQVPSTIMKKAFTEGIQGLMEQDTKRIPTFRLRTLSVDTQRIAKFMALRKPKRHIHFQSFSTD